METVIPMVLVVLACAGILGLLFGGEDGRVFAAIAAMWVTFCIMAFAGVVFVALHFVTKYW